MFALHLPFYTMAVNLHQPLVSVSTHFSFIFCPVPLDIVTYLV